MTALPDTVMPSGPIAYQSVTDVGQAADTEHSIADLLILCLSWAAIISAFGIWLFQSSPDDASMQLIKLAASVVLCAGGIYGLVHGRADEGPEIHLNPQSRQLIVIERGKDGQIRSEVSHDLDSLAEIVLQDRLLTARDAYGRALLMVPVKDAEAERSIRNMLSLG